MCGIMKITENSEVLAENKVLILYILDKVGKPISNDGLYSLVLSCIDLNYFYFEQFLLDLMDANYIIHTTTENGDLYQISKAGKKTLTLTIDILPGIVKLKADTNLKQDVEKVKNTESIVAESTPFSENEFEVKLKIIENNETLFCLKTIAYSREEAQKIIKNWKDNAGKLYPEIMKKISDNK